MEYLSRALKATSISPSFKYHPGCENHNLVQLMIDYLMLFCETEVRSVKILIEAFQSFSTSTGLTANYHKSKIV